MASRNANEKFRINLLGPFELTGPDGSDCTPRGRKARAVLGMIAVSSNGKRSRRWLQDHLWSDRAEIQRASSLRQTLSEIRRGLGKFRSFLSSDHQIIAIDLADTELDVMNFSASTGFTPLAAADLPMFLEGLEIRDPKFEVWLRGQRSYWADALGKILNSSKEVLAATANPGDKPVTGEADNSSGPKIVHLRSIGPDGENSREAVLNSNTLDPFYPGSLPEDNLYQIPHSTLEGSSSSVTPNTPGRQAGIAVLPFDNKTGEETADFLCEGFTGDLIDRLSRVRWLDVISHTSTSFVKKVVSDPQETGIRLGVQYVLEGELRQAEHSLEAKMRLINAVNGFNVWSGNYPISSANTLGSIDEIVKELVGSLDARIDMAEQSRAKQSTRGDMDFISLVWRARWHHNRLTKLDMQESYKLLQKAIALQPDSSEALIQLTWWQLTQVWTQRGNRNEISALRNMAQKAIIADGTDGRGYALAGTAEIWLRHTDQAHLLLTQAISLNPSLAYAYSQLGSCNNLSAQPENAIQPLKTALRLSPHDQLLFYPLGELAMTNWMMGEYRKSIDYANQALSRRQNYWYAHVIKINALQACGDLAAAQGAVRDFQSDRPGFGLPHIRWIPFVDQSWNRKLIKGLLKSGFEKKTENSTRLSSKP